MVIRFVGNKIITGIDEITCNDHKDGVCVKLWRINAEKTRHEMWADILFEKRYLKRPADSVLVNRVIFNELSKNNGYIDLTAILGFGQVLI